MIKTSVDIAIHWSLFKRVEDTSYRNRKNRKRKIQVEFKLLYNCIYEVFHLIFDPPMLRNCREKVIEIIESRKEIIFSLDSHTCMIFTLVHAVVWLYC